MRPTRDVDVPWNVRAGVVTIILTYRQEVPSEQQDSDKQIAAKQKIRRGFSNQLRKHWREQAPLLEWYSKGLPIAVHTENQPCRVQGDSPFFRANICGFSVIPLVSYVNGLTCELKMSFLGEGRSLLMRTGDLDNRVKVVFDALRMPHNTGEVPGSMFGKNDEDLFCLLEDDSLITKFSVEARTFPGSPVKHELTIRAKIEPEGFVHPLLQNLR